MTVLVGAVVMGHVFNMQAIGEYAENDAVIKILRELGVDYAQGNGVPVAGSVAVG